MGGYFNLSTPTEFTIVIKKSKFICNMATVEDEQDAKNFIENVRKRHSLATHNCYAYIADDKGLVQKFSDDGEPQGTAGIPMLEVLKAKKMYKTVAVVTRYFGGVLLGAGGLVRAYSSSVSSCIDSAKVVNMILATEFVVKMDYTVYSKTVSFFNSDNVKVTSNDFSDGVSIIVAVKNDFKEQFVSKLTDLTLGTAKIIENVEKYVGF